MHQGNRMEICSSPNQNGFCIGIDFLYPSWSLLLAILSPTSGHLKTALHRSICGPAMVPLEFYGLFKYAHTYQKLQIRERSRGICLSGYSYLNQYISWIHPIISKIHDFIYFFSAQLNALNEMHIFQYIFVIHVLKDI